jgi:large subunit ribosomal protein L4
MIMKIAVKNLANKEVGTIDLDDSIFAAEVRNDLLHRMVHYQLNKRRAGTHKTKTLDEVSGTGKKPFAQKHTGNARFGTLRAPQMRGGYTVFGPVPRSHATELPRKVRQLALKCAISAKAKEGKLIILENTTTADHKTKAMAKALGVMNIASALIVTGNEMDPKFVLATRNLPKIDVLPSVGANVYDILRRDVLVMTKDAVAQLTERLKD